MRKRAVRDRHPSEVTRKENDKIHHRTQKSHSSIYCLNRLGRNIRPVLPLVSKVLAIVLLLFCLWKILPDLPAVHPRIIQINDRYILQPESIEEITYRTVEPLLQGEIGRYSRHQFDKGDCKAMHQWQDEYIPVCNPFHEIDMYDSTYLASGFWRNVWRMRDGDGSLAAIKTLAWNRNFTLFDQNNHMKDAIAYSVLQSSEFIPNIYGYCSNSAVFDLADGGTFEEMLKDKKKEVIKKWKPKDKLRYAWQMTKAVSDIHSVGNVYNSACISHTDIKSNQYLWMDGMFKLNDLNRAEFIRYNEKEKKACAWHESKNFGKSRSPEEYTEDADLNEQLDVYSLGNVLWSILMEKKVFRGVEDEKTMELVKTGHPPEIPEDVLISYSAMEEAVVHAMQMCFVANPKERPTAMKVEKYLHRKLTKFGVSEL